MGCKKYIMDILTQYEVNELFFASKVFNENLRGKVSEGAYYKTLERMTKSKELIKVSKGVYSLPLNSKYGVIPVSTEEIVNTFTTNNCGTIIGYSLYNSLNISTQVPKTINVLSSSLDGHSKNIKNVFVERVSIYF